MIRKPTMLCAACLTLLALAACGASTGDAAVDSGAKTSRAETDLGNPIWD